MKNIKIYLFLVVCLLSIVYINCSKESEKRYNRNQVAAACTTTGYNRETKELEYYCHGTKRGKLPSLAAAIDACSECESNCGSVIDSRYRCR